jgi:hypothetical protein
LSEVFARRRGSGDRGSEPATHMESASSPRPWWSSPGLPRAARPPQPNYAH